MSRLRAAEQRSDPHVLARRHRSEGFDDLERAADAELGHPMGRQAGNRYAVQENVAAVRVIDAADAVEQRGLARSVGPDDADDVALGDLEGHAVHGGHSAEALGDAAQLQLRLHLPTLWGGRLCPEGTAGWGCRAHSEVSRSDRRRYARLSRARPPKKSITPRGTKITTSTKSRPRMICDTIVRALAETNGMSSEIGRLPPRNWISS